ncbi:hypothetical protein MSBR3_0203 [Methanosarcina barkeri 3]|uniref:Uncharacterized protein n=2 Tax=Methanosarcina barkeri TaxID=2208 RepID=A0A0E3SHR9_METBA|nr:hypothetical protein MSBR3_0203 [Methanosarcina barkeri 3]
MWKTPKTLLWPLLGLQFPKNQVDFNGIEYLTRLFENSFTFHLSRSSTPEILGIGIIVILALHWLIKEFGQNKF